MIRAYKNYWKNYFNFKERTSRKDFWLTILATFLVTFVVAFVIGLIMGGAGKEVVTLNPDGSNIAEYFKSPAGMFSIIWTLINFIPGIAIDVRRMHDINFTGWIVLLALIPYVGSLILFVFSLLPTKPESSRFGAQV